MLPHPSLPHHTDFKRQLLLVIQFPIHFHNSKTLIVTTIFFTRKHNHNIKENITAIGIENSFYQHFFYIKVVMFLFSGYGCWRMCTPTEKNQAM